MAFQKDKKLKINRNGQVFTYYACEDSDVPHGSYTIIYGKVDNKTYKFVIYHYYGRERKHPVLKTKAHGMGCMWDIATPERETGAYMFSSWLKMEIDYGYSSTHFYSGMYFGNFRITGITFNNDLVVILRDFKEEEIGKFTIKAGEKQAKESFLAQYLDYSTIRFRFYIKDKEVVGAGFDASLSLFPEPEGTYSHNLENDLYRADLDLN